MLLMAILAITIGAIWFYFRDQLTLEYFASQEVQLRDRYEARPTFFLAGAFALYVGVAGLALPGAAGLSLAYAWFFGFWPALLLVSFSSTLGAVLSFLLSRFFFGEAIQQKFGNRLESINENFKREGAFYLFTMRLIPAIPFFLVNLLMGLTPIRLVTFWWVSQLGMLPGTCIFIYAGSSVPSLKELAEQGVSGILKPEIFVAFVLLGLFPLVIKRIMGRSGNRSVPAP